MSLRDSARIAALEARVSALVDTVENLAARVERAEARRAVAGTAAVTAAPKERKTRR